MLRQISETNALLYENGTKRKAVIYCRVSSAQQVAQGHGLSSQETKCRSFAKGCGLEIIQVFNEEGVSGSLIQRPAMKDLLNFIRKRRTERIVVLIDDISRLARDVKAHIELRLAIREAGGELQAPSLDFGEDSDKQLVEYLLATVSQHARQKNVEQVKGRMAARLANGFWVLKLPLGYKFGDNGEGKLPVRDEPLASVVAEGLEGFATGRFATTIDLLAFFRSHSCFPRDMTEAAALKRVRKMLQYRLYTGHYEFPKWNISMRKGKHEALISLETFDSIQERLNGAVRPLRSDIHADFPLRGFLLCAACQKPMTACWSRGRSRAHPYYFCKRQGCPQKDRSFRRETVEGEFETILKDVAPKPQTIELMKALVERGVQQWRSKQGCESEELQRQLQLVEGKIKQSFDRILSVENSTLIKSYESQVERLERERLEIQDKLARAGSELLPKRQLGRTAFEFLAEPHKQWVSRDLLGRQRLLGLVFSAPLAYEGNTGFQTAALSLPFSVLGQFDACGSSLVDSEEASSNIIVRLIKEIERIERVLAADRSVKVDDQGLEF